MVIKKGDFITVDYTCKVKESEEIVDTTLKDIAKKEKFPLDKEENIEFEPLFLIIGEEWINKGVDEAIEEMDVGQEKSIEIPPEKGFGSRDPSKMRLLPLKRFSKEGLTPIPGVRVQVDGKQALVRSVGAGRVQVDFNHPLAGKTLLYDLKIISIIEENIEKIKKLVHRDIKLLDLQKTEIYISNDNLEINIPQESFFSEGLQYAKRQLANNIFKYLPTFNTIIFKEKHSKSTDSDEAEQKKSSSSSNT